MRPLNVQYPATLANPAWWNPEQGAAATPLSMRTWRAAESIDPDV